MAAGTSYFQIATAVSPDNKILAYGVDTLSGVNTSSASRTSRPGNLSRGNSMTAGYAVWADDNKTVFYPVIDDSLRSYKIFRHAVGAPASADVEIYHEEDPTFALGLDKSRSKKYIFLVASSTLTTEYRFLFEAAPAPRRLRRLPAENPRPGIQRRPPRRRFHHFDQRPSPQFPPDGSRPRPDGPRPMARGHPPPGRRLSHRISFVRRFPVLREQKGGLSHLRVIPKGEKEGL